MKINIKYIALLLAGGVMLFSGCKRGDSLYTSPNNPAKVTAPLFLTSIEGIFIDKGVNLLSDGTYQTNATPVQSMQDFWGKYSATATTEGSVFDASYVKLREVTLSYAFPQNYIPFKNVIKDLQIGFEARNLWLIKSFVPHVDPELSYFGNGSAGDGVEFNSFPSSKTYGVNLKVKF